MAGRRRGARRLVLCGLPAHAGRRVAGAPLPHRASVDGPHRLAVHVIKSASSAPCSNSRSTRWRRTALTGTRRGPFSFLKINITLLTYWAIVGVTYAVEQYRHTPAMRELQAAQLQTALARAQVQSLQMQLHPHFLFNTLNAIAALMREDVEAADVMIARLGDLLRAALATAQRYRKSRCAGSSSSCRCISTSNGRGSANG